MPLSFRNYNIVLLGESFPVDKINAEDFTFGDQTAHTTFKVPQMLQAEAGKYTVQVLPDRFQVAANNAKATEYRIEHLVLAALFFLDEFTSRRAITAVGHNFIGTFSSAAGSAWDFMDTVAPRASMTDALSGRTITEQSLTTKFSVEGATSGQIRLEPSAENANLVFCDSNVTWGDPRAPQRLDVENLVRLFGESAAMVDGLVTRLQSIGGTA